MYTCAPHPSLGKLVFSISLFLWALLAMPMAAQAFFTTDPVDINGYAWSSTIGWISLGNGGAEQVTINTDGTVTGYAWSSNIGWIQFGGLSSFPGSGGNANMVDVGGGNYEMRGWARACAGTEPGDCFSMANRNDGWDGWIALSGASHSVQFNASGPLSNSYAWGDDVVGWIDMFSHVTYTAPPSPCDDGIDNDGDGFTDHPDDPGCSDPDDTTEGPAHCSDPGADNYQAAGSCTYPTAIDIEGVSLSPSAGSNHTEGDTITFSGRLDNNGPSDLTTGVWADVEFDTNNNGAADQNYNASGGSQVTNVLTGNSRSLTYSTNSFAPGTYRYRFNVDTNNLLSETDENNNVSAWRSFTVVAATLPQCSDGVDNDADGFTDYPDDPGCSSTTDDDEGPAHCSDPGAQNYQDAGSCIYTVVPDLTARPNSGTPTDGPLTINPGDPVTVDWTSTNADTCTGTNFATSNATSGTDVDISEPAPGTTETYTLSCTGPGGTEDDAVVITTRARPNLDQPSISTLNSSTGFNPGNGEYDSVQVSFNVQNDSGTSPTGAFSNRFQFDEGNTGSFDMSTTRSVSNLNSGETSANETITLTNVPYGFHRIRVTADQANDVVESNESDNVRTVVYTLPPPLPPLDDPNVGIWADQEEVAAGDQTTIRWNTGVSYPLDCTVIGTNVNVSFDPSVSGQTGNESTGPVRARQEYTLSCTEPTTGTTFSESVMVATPGTVEEI